MNIQEKIGERIKLLRKQKGWTQEVAAEKINLSVTAYSKIERGQTDISLSRLESIAKVFEIETDSLMTTCQVNNFTGNSFEGSAVNHGKLTHKHAKDKAVQEVLWKLSQTIEELKQKIEVLESRQVAAQATHKE